MPKKGKEKNTNNKAKHSKLIHQKINKIKRQKANNRERLKAIIKKANEEKESKNPTETSNLTNLIINRS